MDKQIEDLIRIAIFYIPPVTAVYLGYVKHLDNREKSLSRRLDNELKIEVEKAKQNSVGEEAIKDLSHKLDLAREDRQRMKEEQREMREDFKAFKEEIKYIVDTIRKHGLEEINISLDAIKKLNQNR